MPKPSRAKRPRRRSAGFLASVLERLVTAPEPQRPWVSLVFLAPALAFYTGGLAWVRPDLASAGDLLLRRGLAVLGLTGATLPAAVVVVALVTWHLVRRDPWRFPLRVLPAMLAETAILFVPLLALHALFRAIDAIMEAVLAIGPAAGPGWLEAVMSSIGTGIYEELLFRLVLVGGLLLVCRKVLDLKGNGAVAAAVLIAAGLFAGAHTLYAPQWFTWPTFLFRTAAGIWLGFLFAKRGFGIAAGVHIGYNLFLKGLSLAA